MLFMPNHGSIFKKKRYRCNKCGSVYRMKELEVITKETRCPKCGGKLTLAQIDPLWFM